MTEKSGTQKDAPPNDDSIIFETPRLKKKKAFLQKKKQKEKIKQKIETTRKVSPQLTTSSHTNRSVKRRKN